MKVGYIINTHAGYLKPLNNLLESIHGACVVSGTDLTNDVLIVSGGNIITQLPRFEKYRGVPLLEVEHDSWDYTGLIELVMNPGAPFFENHTHFFCLQDTMEFGSKTHALVGGADPEKLGTAAFGGQCNLVLYRRDYLITMREYILARRNNTKHESIQHEGELWKMLRQNLSRRHEDTFYPGTHEITGKAKPYSDVERIREYYAGVDIIKWKANYGQNMHALIEKP